MRKVKMFEESENVIGEINEFIKGKENVNIDRMHDVCRSAFDTLHMVWWDVDAGELKYDPVDKSCLLEECSYDTYNESSTNFINIFNKFVDDKDDISVEYVPGLNCLFVRWYVYEVKKVKIKD